MNAFKCRVGMIYIVILVLVVCSIPAMHGVRRMSQPPADYGEWNRHMRG